VRENGSHAAFPERTQESDMKKTLVLAAIVAASAAAIVASPASASVTTLNFSGAICGATGTSVCSNGAQIGAGYGDSAQLDVRYASIDGPSGATLENFLRAWATGFGNLSGIAYAGGGNTSAVEIFLKPAAGYEVALLDFDFSTYQRRVPNVPIKIMSGSGALLQQSTVSTNAPTHATYAANTDFYRTGIVLRFGPNAFDAGLDNLRFEVRESTVPEPGAWALMLLGFGGMGAMLRRRTRVLAA
jgi:hypothetical protein